MDFEQQLTQMIPVIRAKEPKRNVRIHSFAKIALGFILGVFATYYTMQPSDAVQKPERQATYELVLDDANLQQLRRPMDIVHCIVRVPLPPPPIDEPVQWQNGTMRNTLLQL